MTKPWKAFVVGVDGSPEAAWAAAVAGDAARAAGTTCHLVHATQDVWSGLALAELPERAGEFGESLFTETRERVQHGLWGVVPPDLVEGLTVRAGRAPAVFHKVVGDLAASLLVLGGKRHSILGRWLAGSTCLNVVRTADVPVLVTGTSRAPIRRVLAAVDLSAAARPTIEMAERIAALFGAKLRVVSVLEPLPIIPEAPNYDLSAYYAMLEDHLARDVWPLVHFPGAEKGTRYGMPVEALMAEVAEWHADLLVVGSHGKGWVDRLLIGSVTERLLNHLPASLLVVPVYAHVEAHEPARVAVPGARPAMA